MQPQQIVKSRRLAKQLTASAAKKAFLEVALLLDPTNDPARRLLELPILRYVTEKSGTPLKGRKRTKRT